LKIASSYNVYATLWLRLAGDSKLILSLARRSVWHIAGFAHNNRPTQDRAGRRIILRDEASLPF
jgi:hypothetical protein